METIDQLCIRKCSAMQCSLSTLRNEESNDIRGCSSMKTQFKVPKGFHQITREYLLTEKRWLRVSKTSDEI